MRRSSLLLILYIVALGIIFLIAKDYSSRSITAHIPFAYSDIPFQSPDVRLVVYNRVPKTGSTALVKLVSRLARRNNIGMSFLNITGKAFYMSRINQLLLVRNLTERSYLRPFMLHGHFVYLNFHIFGSTLRPIYVNMVRDPLERLVSYYYFLRFGDDYRPNVVRLRMSDSFSRSLTFDDCVRLGGPDCHPKDLWIQIPFFCGNAAYCRIPGNRAALQTAKRRVVEDYLVVGLTERFDDFVLVLEKLLPRFFRGAFQLFHSLPDWRIRRTRHKPPISNLTRSLFHQNPVWKMEQEFYEFVREEFWSLRNALVNGPSVKTLGNITFDHVPWNNQIFAFSLTEPRD